MVKKQLGLDPVQSRFDGQEAEQNWLLLLLNVSFGLSLDDLASVIEKFGVTVTYCTPFSTPHHFHQPKTANSYNIRECHECTPFTM